MAKTYINTVKYMIKMKFEIDGIVDKPDIIGAIFGQSEGLLGDEMDLKELQKNGKIGRIEINHTTAMGRTKGEVLVPSSMDMAETSLLAASIESVDKVGPCQAKFEIDDIDDTRTSKRQEIKDRAKELLKKMMDKSSPETQTLRDEIRENVRAAEITEYGPDKLPAGPDIEISEEIIVVEGRADVLNMLRNQIKNVIGMNGSNISSTISELGKKKSITAFVDGDRGGILNARKLAQLARIAYIAKAPDGKEVEELTRKEILQSLKKRVPAEEELSERKFPGGGEFRERAFQERPFRERGFRERSFGQRSFGGGMRDHGDRGSRPTSRWGNRDDGMRPDRRERREFVPRETIAPREPIQEFPARPTLSQNEESVYRPILDELKGTMKARILDDKNKQVKEVEVKNLVEEMAKIKNAHSIVFDGVITKRLFDAAEKAGAKYVVGVRKGKIEENGKVKAVTL